jgi:hypothetical protein
MTLDTDAPPRHLDASDSISPEDRYRADAIRRWIETDLERTLQASLQHYIRLGAPLGVDDELLQPRASTRLR